MTREIAAEALIRYDVPVFPVRGLEEILLDKTLSQRRFDLEIGSTSPFLIDNLRPAVNGHVPNHGQNTKQILMELGYTDDQIIKLSEEKIILCDEESSNDA